MKVFLLMYYDYDDTTHHGVYSTADKANAAADEISENSRYPGTNFFTYTRKYFSVEEIEVV